MRVWDIHPGYLNRQSLLGEHRELHGIVSIARNHKKGYSSHPETLRWIGYGWALSRRHKLIVAEMVLRGYQHHSPVKLRSNNGVWPDSWIDPPAKQMQILTEKYKDKSPGRIPIPSNCQQLWAQHKYSVMARDLDVYKEIGQQLSSVNVKCRRGTMEALSERLALMLCQPADPQRLRNALLHMWGYISDYADSNKRAIDTWSNRVLLKKIQHYAKINGVEYLLHSTALSELNARNNC